MKPSIRRSLYRPVSGGLFLLVLASACGGGSAGLGSATPPPAASSPRSPASPSALPTASAPRCDKLPTLIGTVLDDKVVARTAPDPSAPVVATFHKINPQGAPQVFDLDGEVHGAGGDLWYQALLPVRPNGQRGFIPAGSVSLAQTGYLLQISEERFTLTLWNGCTKTKAYPIGLGKDSTPTPKGRYYLISLMKPPDPNGVYGVYAYGLSAYSQAIKDWVGGGVIGLHGTNDPSSVGKRASHGCIRMRNSDIDALAKILPLGTPVVIE